MTTLPAVRSAQKDDSLHLKSATHGEKTRIREWRDSVVLASEVYGVPRDTFDVRVQEQRKGHHTPARPESPPGSAGKRPASPRVIATTSDRVALSVGNAHLSGDTAEELFRSLNSAQAGDRDQTVLQLLQVYNAHCRLFQAVNSCSDPESGLMALVGQAYDLLKAERISIFVVDRRLSRLRLAIAKDLERGFTVPLSSGIVGTAATRGHVINVQDAQTDDRFFSGVDKLSNFTTRSVLAVPIMIAGNVHGVMMAINKIPTPGDAGADGSQIVPFTANDENLAREVANFAAVHLQNVSLFADAMRNRALARRLLRMFSAFTADMDSNEAAQRIVEYSYDLLEAERISIYLADALHNELECIISKDVQGHRLPVDKGIAGHVFREGKVIHIADAYADPRFYSNVDHDSGFKTGCVLCSPIHDAKGETIGVITAINKKNSDDFTRDDVHVIEAISAQAGIVLYSTDQLNRAKKMVRLNRVLGDVSKWTKTGIEISECIISETKDLCGASICRLYIFKESEGLFWLADTTEPPKDDDDDGSENEDDGKVSTSESTVLGQMHHDINTVCARRHEDAEDELNLLAEDAKHAMCAPILKDKHVVGAIYCAQTSPDSNGFRTTEISTLETLANVAATVLPAKVWTSDVPTDATPGAGEDDVAPVSRAISRRRTRRSVFEQVTSSFKGTIILDVEGVVLRCDCDTDVTLGLKPNDIVGKKFANSVGSADPILTAEINSAIHGGEEVADYHIGHHITTKHPLPSGNTEVNCMVVPIHIDEDEDGGDGESQSGKPAYVVVLEERTEITKVSHRLKKAELRINNADAMVHENLKLKNCMQRALTAAGEYDSFSSCITRIASADAPADVLAATLTIATQVDRIAERNTRLGGNVAQTAGSIIVATDEHDPDLPNFTEEQPDERLLAWASDSYKTYKAPLAEIDQRIADLMEHPGSGPLQEWDFDVLDFHGHKHALKTISSMIFVDLLQVNTEWSVGSVTLSKFIDTVCAHYFDVPFHSFTHGVCVQHASYYLLYRTTAGDKLSSFQKITTVISALAHDVGHPGHNNLFEIVTENPRALTYNDQSVLENHHCALMFRILNVEQCNILQGLTAEERKEFRALAVHSILATDMAGHFPLVAKFNGAETSEEMDKQVLAGMMLHAADLSNPARRGESYLRWGKLVHAEFDLQVQNEEGRGLTPASFMKAENFQVRARQEVGFIAFVIMPMWQAMAKKFPDLNFCVDNLNDNKVMWEELSTKQTEGEESSS
uniref:Phosphodiesterase n=1 Tax=Phaeomonas parva TaxID=124430 RepID=A0A7S1XXC1_9STRA|mmetsp:Transcript_46051/g.144104  ORF Transcript_46051/g.144104 Transcript_46051/m.144104 type:complete len:1253 (+) Transcript_46051:158-3916(+)